MTQFTWKHKIFLITIGLAIAFLLGEVSLRFLGYSSELYTTDTETQLTTLKPDSNLSYRLNCLHNIIKTNALGFHDQTFETTKDESTVRIAILGDSFVEAIQVPYEKTFHKILESRLNSELDDEVNFEVYSFGRSGNGNLLNYLYLKNYALDFNPDLVINTFTVTNDFRDDSEELFRQHIEQQGDLITRPRPFPVYNNEGQLDLELSEQKYKQQILDSSEPFLKSTLKHSVLVVQLYFKLQTVYTKAIHQLFPNESNENVQETIETETPIGHRMYLVETPDVWNDAWELEEGLLSSIANLSGSIDASYVLVSLADQFRNRQSFVGKEEFDIEKPERLLSEIAERQGFSYLSLSSYFTDRYLLEPIQTKLSCDGHWNEDGHHWVADALFDYLTSNANLLRL